MATKKTTARKRSRQQPSPLPALYYQLNSFLHTVRCIAHHEDELCTLLHDIKSSNQVGGDLAIELGSLLELLPMNDYADELAALQTSLAGLPVLGTISKSKKTILKRAAR